MKCWCSLFAGICCAAVHVTAQQAPEYSCKLDLTAPFQQHYGAAFHVNLNAKNALELYCGYGTYPVDNTQIFNGYLVVRYAEQRVDTLSYSFNEPIASSKWQPLGEGEPLSYAPPYVPYNFFQTRLGFRFLFKKKKSQWSLFIQPGIQLNRHRYYEVSQSLVLEKDIRESWVEGEYPFQYRIALRMAHYRQTRFMRLRTGWQFGLSYDAGVTRKFGKHFFLEGRLVAGANLWLPYEEPKPPAPVRRFWARPALLAGWMF